MLRYQEVNLAVLAIFKRISDFLDMLRADSARCGSENIEFLLECRFLDR